MSPGPTLSIRLRSAKERQAIDEAAKKAGELPTRWMRRVLLEAAGAPTKEPPEAEAARRMARGESEPWRESGTLAPDDLFADPDG